MYDDIFLLIQLINAGNFSALAQKMGVAQSTISRKMESLERSLGVKLFNRNSHNLELTKEGQVLYRNFGQCEQKLAQLISPIYQNSQTITGRLKILLPVSFSHYAITPFIAEFSRSNPNLSLILNYDFQSINMSKDDYDIAIVPYIPNQTTQKIKQINRCKIIIVCS